MLFEQKLTGPNGTFVQKRLCQVECTLHNDMAQFGVPVLLWYSCLRSIVSQLIITKT